MLIALALALGAATPVEATQHVERIALAVGVDDGGPGRPRLRYAGSDARSFARVLVELGGVAAEDAVVLVDRDRAAIEEALAAVDDKARAIKASGKRAELVFYYSGHSDEDGLLVEGERLPYAWLRDRIAASAADVRVVVVDACASGALVRKKGGAHVPAFVVDESGHVEGQAILTSSRDDEASQESDRIGGSFFTQALVSGLRGAADTSGDGLVTLHEAYQFAFDDTLARTSTAAAGAQHPAWDIQLAGTGDFVVTDLRAVSAGLVIGADVKGRVVVRDDGDHVVVELVKANDAPLLLGLAPGKYVVTVTSDVVREANVALTENDRTELKDAMLVATATIPSTARGDSTPSATTRAATTTATTVAKPAKATKLVSLEALAVGDSEQFGARVGVGGALHLAFNDMHSAVITVSVLPARFSSGIAQTLEHNFAVEPQQLPVTLLGVDLAYRFTPIDGDVLGWRLSPFLDAGPSLALNDAGAWNVGVKGGAGADLGVADWLSFSVRGSVGYFTDAVPFVSPYASTTTPLGLSLGVNVHPW